MMRLKIILSLLFMSGAIFCHAFPRVEEKFTKGSIEDLAERAGFAAKLPKETEIYVSYQGLDQLVRSMIDSKIGKAIDELAPENHGLKQEILEDRGYEEMMLVAAEDVFIAGGKKSSHVVELIARFASGMMQYEMRREFLRMVARMEGDEEWWRAGLRGTPDFVTDRTRGLQLLKDLEINPIYAGFKVSEKERRDALIKLIQDELNKPVEFQPKEKVKQFIYAAKSDVAGGFSGFRFSGADMAKSIRGERQETRMKKNLGEDIYVEGMKEIVKREFVLMAGVVGDYIVFYAGKSVNEIGFAKSVGESLLAHPEIDFVRNYADKNLKGLIFFSDAAMKDIHSLKSELPMIAKAYSKVLEKSEYFGDTREIQDLINKVGESSEFLFNWLPKKRLGAVMYLEDGFKMDSYLGEESSVFDLDSKRKLALLANHDGAMFSASWVLQPQFSKKLTKLLEATTSATYKIFQLAVEQDVHDDEWLEFATNFRVADAEFSDDLLRLWKAVQSGLGGLSNEHAVMIDLKGRMPSAIPEVPKFLKEQGVVPRLSYGNSVTDRAALSTAWDKVSAATKDIGNGIGKLTREEVTIPKPVLVNQAGMDLWSYGLESWDHDFKPTLGINDQLFFFSTSPNYIRELAQKKVAASEPGAEIVIRLAPVREAVNHWLKVIEEHGEEFMSEREVEEFNVMAPQIKKFIEASKVVKKLDIYTRKVDGEIRNTIHFHTQ